MSAGIERTLKVSQAISASTDVADSYTPANNEEVYIYAFDAEACFTQNSVVCLLWDYGGENEEIIWSSKGSSVMPFSYTLTGDGTKELAVCCSNGEAGELIMSGYVEFSTK